MNKVIFVGLLLFCGGFLTWGNSATASSAVEPGDGEITGIPFHEILNCSRFSGGVVNVLYNLKLPGPILCDAEATLVIPEGYNIVIKAEGAMKFERVHFFVAPGAQLTLAAENGIALARNEDKAFKDVAVAEVAGKLIVHAGQPWDPTRKLADEFAVPRKSQQNLLIVRNGFGSVYTEQEVTFTKHAIIVSAVEDDTSKVTRQQAKEETEQQAATDEGDLEDGDIRTDTLKAGQVLYKESLKSSDRAYELWVGKHGSVLFAEYLKNEHAKDGQASKMEGTTLISANETKVKAALGIRAKLPTKEKASGGRVTTSRRSWTPWGRSYNRRVLRARQHAGEVKLTVDNRGCLEVTLDGTCVLSRSGPHSREWVNRCASCLRKKSPDYELRVVDDGMEVQREGRKIWGVSVPKPDAGERTFFGITAADIQ